MMPADTPSGLLILDKPRGPTSHDAVAHVRRVLRTRSVGHAGTLDPMATGVLLVMVGLCTRLSGYLTLDRKCYEARLQLGQTTDTCDATGRVVASTEVPQELREALGAAARGQPAQGEGPDLLSRALGAERERTLQVPPAHAAIKQQGVAAYKRARRGEQVTLPPREVRVYELRISGASAEHGTLDVVLDVSKGYYVRAWARDMGEALGVGAHLSALRRTSSGPYRIEDALGWDDGEQAWRRSLIPLEAVAKTLLGEAVLSAAGVRRALQGQRLSDEDFEHAPGAGTTAWFAEDGSLVAIGDRSRGGPTVVRAFPRSLEVC